MRTWHTKAAALAAAALIAGCSQPVATPAVVASPGPALGRDALFQFSLLSSLMAGGYDGDFPIAELRRRGDLGLGTLNRLDGELVVIDGKAFDVGVDGKVRPVGDEEQTPFAAVTFFDADQTIELTSGLGLDALKARIDQARTTSNLPYAVRIDGTFAKVRTRSVPAQNRPYRPLPEVLKSQQEFSFTDVAGTIVGFWLPDYMDGPNASGYHLHFLSADRSAGGHLLDAETRAVTVGLDQTSLWRVWLPTSGDFLTQELAGESYR